MRPSCTVGNHRTRLGPRPSHRARSQKAEEPSQALLGRKPHSAPGRPRRDPCGHHSKGRPASLRCAQSETKHPKAPRLLEPPLVPGGGAAHSRSPRRQHGRSVRAPTQDTPMNQDHQTEGLDKARRCSPLPPGRKVEPLSAPSALPRLGLPRHVKSSLDPVSQSPHRMQPSSLASDAKSSNCLPPRDVFAHVTTSSIGTQG